jgi:hypothetical protein
MNAAFLWDNIPETPTIQKWGAIRQYRTELLSSCDWTQLPDAALTLEEKQAWSGYRQALRDIPQNFLIPEEVVFPETP